MDTIACDVCGGTEGVEAITISRQGRAFVVNLCNNETGTLNTWEKAGSAGPRNQTAQSGKPQAHRVVPID